jgi:hypothetical protein
VADDRQYQTSEQWDEVWRQRREGRRDAAKLAALRRTRRRELWARRAVFATCVVAAVYLIIHVALSAFIR